MAAAEGEPMSIECGFCCLKNKDIQDPRVLPCSHIFCRGCLAGQLEHLKVVRCPPCSKVFDVVVDNLPTYNLDGPKHKCGPCAKRGKYGQAAVMYCKTCNRKCCEKHQESHDDMDPDHVTISIAEYEIQADRLETRNCIEHKEQPYSLGCGVCLTVFCNSCISPMNFCANGKSHELHNLSDLVTRLTGDIDKLREDMMCKEEKLSALFKKSSKSISEYEQETKEMVEKLHQTRDEQMDALHTKYQRMEEELLKKRKETQKEMMEFMEDQVGTKLTNLSNQRMLIETRVRNNHQVDIVNTYRDTQAEITKLTDGVLPELTLDNVKSLVVRDEMRDIEVEIVSAHKIHISCEPGLVVKPPPTSLTLLNSVETGSFCHSICHYKGNTYLGTRNNSVDLVGSDSKLKAFVVERDLLVEVYGIAAHENEVYTLLTFRGRCAIHLYDLSGKLTNQWTRSEKCQNTRPAIVSNQIIIPDCTGSQLVLYSLSGDVIKHISCPQLQGDATASCAVDENSVIVTSYNHSLVFRVDITSGQTVWSSNDVAKPQATAMYGRDLVCIASEKKITFLNAYTGEMVSEIAAADVNSGLSLISVGKGKKKVNHCVDIDIHEDTLIVSTAKGGSKVLYYKLHN